MISPLYKQTLYDFIWSLKEERQTGLHFIDGEEDERFVSYAELFANASTLLGYLQAKGLQEGEELVIQTEQNERLLTAFWACILGKILPVPLSVGRREVGLRKLFLIWENLNSPFLFTDPEHFNNVLAFADLEQKKAEMQTRFINAALPMECGNPPRYGRCSSSDLAFIQYSSGSTGNPKGVMLTHKNLAYNVNDCVEGAEISRKSRGLSWIPLTHDLGMIAFHISHLAVGASQFMMPTSLFIRRPLLWMKKASQHRATILYSPNFGIKYYLDAMDDRHDQNLELSAVTAVINGAEPISAIVCRAFTEKLSKYGLNSYCIQPSYGLAEATVGVSSAAIQTPLQEHFLLRTSLSVGDPVRYLDDDEPAHGIGFINLGKTFRHTAVKICDDQENVLPVNHLGHILIKGPNVTKGYYNHPIATREVFTADQWLKTGDVGFLRNDGSLVVTGRYKNMLILQGQNYYAHDIERSLHEIDQLDFGKIAVVGISGDSQAEEKLLVFVAYKKPLQQFIALIPPINERLHEVFGFTATYVIPIRGLPKTTSGKVQHFNLATQYQQGKFDHLIAEIATLIEQRKEVKRPKVSSVEALIERLRDLICSITRLPRQNIGPQTDIGNLAIDSLVFIKILHALNQEYGSKITPGLLYQEVNTLEKLANYLLRETKSQAKPAEIEHALSVSPSTVSVNQKALWYAERMQPGTDHNIGLCFRAEGSFEEEMWRKNLVEVINRHDALRYSFYEEAGEVKKLVAPHLADGSIVIAQAKDAAAAEDKLQSLMQQPFDLSKAPLLRLIVVPYAPKHHLVAICLHHIIADGWSLETIFRELILLANGSNLGRPMATFDDHIAAEQQTIKSDVLTQATTYYRDLFDIAFKKPTFLGLGTSPGSIEQSNHYLRFKWDALPIHKISEEQQATPFLVLLAIYHLLLSKYISSREVITATPVSRRDDLRWQNTVGYFSNLQYLRTDLSSTDTFSDIILRLKKQFYGAYAWQALPYAKLVETVFDHTQNEKKNLLHQFVFSYHALSTFDTESGQADAASFERILLPQQATAFPLALEVFEQKGQLVGFLKYRASSTSRIAKAFVENFEYLLTYLSNCAHQPIQELEVLAPAQRASIFAGGCPPALHPSQKKHTIVSAFEQRVEATPDNLALTFEDESLTYRDLNQIVNQFARYLRDRKELEADDRICIKLPAGKWQVVSVLAVLKAGAAYVPIDQTYPEHRKSYMEQDANPKLVIDEAALAHFRKMKANFSTDNLTLPIRHKQLAYVLYTSGTTGKPKGVMIEHAALVSYAETCKNYFSLCEEDIVIQQSSISFDTMVEEIFPCLLAGAKLLIVKHGGKDIGGLIKAIVHQGATVLSTTPLVINELNKELPAQHSLRIIISGGDQLKAAHIDRLIDHNLALYNTYGPTETTVCASFHRIEKRADAHCIGKVIPHRSVFILDEQQKPVPAWVEGEIYIGGIGMARGYLNQPTLTAEKFIPHPFVAGEQLYKTGDLGYWDAQSQIYFLGRKDQQIKMRGYRIEVAEVEHAVAQYPGIVTPVVTAMKTEQNSHRLLAFFTGEKTIDPQALRAFVSELLPTFMVPAHFIQVEEMPMTDHGKIDVPTLMLDHAETLYSFTTYVAPQTPTEKQLAAIWEQTLEHEEKQSIGIYDDFFERGGNSLSLMKVKNAIEIQFQLNISLDILIKSSTLKSLAAYVDSALWVLACKTAPASELNKKEVFEV